MKVNVCWAFVALNAAVVTLLTVSAPALAVNEYLPGAPFGSAGSGDGQFDEPIGAAVNDSSELAAPAKGNVYIADKGNNRVERFGAAGTFEGQFNGSGTFTNEKGVKAPEPLSAPEWIAVDNSGKTVLEDPSVEDVYVTDAGHKIIDRFSATGIYEGQLAGTCETPGGSPPCPSSKLIPFGTLLGVAVDLSGNVWVHDDNGNFDEFDDLGVFLKTFNNERPPQPGGLALDSTGENIYAMGAGEPHVLQFESATGAEVSEVGSDDTALAIAPLTNNLLVDVGSKLELYTGALEHRQTFATEGLVESHGIGVSATGTVFATQRADDHVEIFDFVLLPGPSTEPASEVSTTQETLHGTVNPEGAATSECRFEYGIQTNAGDPEQNVPPVFTYEHTAACAQTPAEIGEGTEPVAVSAELASLQPGATYHFRLSAANTNGTKSANDETFVLFPNVAAESVSSTGSTEVTTSAQINAGGVPTTYRVEYGTTIAYGSSTPEVSIGAPPAAVAVSTRIPNLQPGTAYHFRFVATSALGSTPGADAAFTTGSGGAVTLTLPDNRAYELVSGINNPGDVFVPGSGLKKAPTELTDAELPFRAAADGNALAYVGYPGNSGGNGFSGEGAGNEFLATRNPQQGRWDPTDITPEVAGVNPGESEESINPYEYFTSDLSLGVLSTVNAPAFAASARPEGPAQCNALYARTDSGFHGLFSETQTPEVCGRALAHEGGYSAQSLLLAAASADGSQLLFQTPAPLTAGDQESTAGEEGNNLYESVAGQPHAVSVLPDGTRTSEAVFGSTSGEALPNEGGSFYPGDFSNVLSADGNRAFWTALEPVQEPFEGKATAAAERLKALYARENPSSSSATTVQLDAAQQGAPGTSGGGRFWTANTEGSKVFFTDCSRLTQGATAVSSDGCSHTVSKKVGQTFNEKMVISTGNDLYEYDFAKESGHRLTDLTVDSHTGEPLRADVQGVIGASNDGSYVYFVAGGALAPGAEQRNCREPKEEQNERHGELTPSEEEQLQAEQKEEEHGHLPQGRGCNLYVVHGGAPPTFIAALAAKDDRLRHAPRTSERLGDWLPDQAYRTAEVTPDGRHLVFESTQQLTGYDNTVLDSGGESQLGLEVFVYAAEPGGPGHLICASCEPGGAPPAQEGAGSNGTYLPASLTPTFMQRWISEDGSRVFFDSSQPLVPQDKNDVQDVYEWEGEGEGTCTLQTPSRPNRGCVYLLSGANTKTPSYLLDADASGENVFFTHRGQLGQAAIADPKNDVFDARVNGGFPQASVACTGTGCQGVPPAAPTFATPPSVTFNGTGNLPPPAPAKPKTTAQIRAEQLARALKACRAKKNKHKRALCEAQGRKRYGPPRRAKKSNAKRKAKR